MKFVSPTVEKGLIGHSVALPLRSVDRTEHFNVPPKPLLPVGAGVVDAAQPAAQDAQLPLMSPELLGTDAAARHQIIAKAIHGRQAIGALDDRMQQIIIGWCGV